MTDRFQELSGGFDTSQSLENETDEYPYDEDSDIEDLQDDNQENDGDTTTEVGKGKACETSVRPIYLR